MSSMLLIMQLVWLFFLKKNCAVFITVSAVSILPMFR